MSDFQDLILKAIYENITEELLYRISLNEIKSSEELKELTIQELFNSLELLQDKKYLSYQEYITEADYLIKINIKGILKFEKDHPDIHPEFTILTKKFLSTVKDIEDEKITLEPGEGEQIGRILVDDFLTHSNIKKQDFDKVNFIRHSGDETFHRGIGWTNKGGFLFFGKNLIFLTPRGREFLEFQNNLENLFSNVSSTFGKQVLLEEYSDLHFLMRNGKWKDVLIKMGSIVEYLVYDHIDHSGLGIDNNGNPLEYEISDFDGRKRKIKLIDSKFGRRLLFIIQHNVFDSKWASDWTFVNNIIREFRNYIHISKLVSNNIIVDFATVQSIYPIFERIITLF